jgi:hypothetical protein
MENKGHMEGKQVSRLIVYAAHFFHSEPDSILQRIFRDNFSAVSADYFPDVFVLVIVQGKFKGSADRQYS